MTFKDENTGGEAWATKEKMKGGFPRGEARGKLGIRRNKNRGVHKMRLPRRHFLFIFLSDGRTDRRTDILMSFMNCP